jgi:hypothetical protein
MNVARVLSGVAVMALVGLIAREAFAYLGLAALIGPATSNIAESAAVSLLAAICGGYVARERFVVPALSICLLSWCAAIYLLYLIAAPTGQAHLGAILGHNWVAILASLLAAAAGAVAGQAFARRQQPNNSSKPTPLRGAA